MTRFVATVVATLTVLTLMRGVARAEASPVVPPRRLDSADVPYPAQGQGDASVRRPAL